MWPVHGEGPRVDPQFCAAKATSTLIDSGGQIRWFGMPGRKHAFAPAGRIRRMPGHPGVVAHLPARGVFFRCLFFRRWLLAAGARSSGGGLARVTWPRGIEAGK